MGNHLIEVKHCHRFIDITQQKNGNATDTIAQEAKGLRRSPANFQRLPFCEPHDLYSHTSLKLLNYLNAVLPMSIKLLKVRLNAIKNNVTRCTMNGTKLNVRFAVVTFLNYSQLEMHENFY